MNQDKKYKSTYIRRLKKTVTDKTPIPFSQRHIKKALEPVRFGSMEKILFQYHNNFHTNSRMVKIEYHEDGIKKYRYERKSFFEKITDDKYKCLICYSIVEKKVFDGNDVFLNPNGDFHRKQISRDRNKGMICVFDTNITHTEKKKHVGKMKPLDNSFMII